MLVNTINSDISLSKTLSWLLRHGANKEGLHISRAGYISVEEVLNHPKLRGYSVADIRRVVETNDKQRFTLRETSGLLEIKANQGHSIKNVDESQLKPITSSAEVENVIHGTYFRCLDSIKQNGLSRMNRNHIHFASGLPTSGEVISGARKNAQVFVYVDLDKALSDGLKFFLSENGVILTPGNSEGYLRPKYFIKICKVDGTILS